MQQREWIHESDPCGVIRSVQVQKRDNDSSKSIESVKIVFGHHHYITITTSSRNNRVFVEIGATHHGVRLDASCVGGEFERVIEMLRQKFPEKCTD